MVLALGIVFFADDETAEVVPQSQSSSVIVEGQNNTAMVTEGSTKESLLINEKSNLQTELKAENILSIDIARVKPDGSAVVAGHTQADAVVSVFEDKILLGKTTSDTNGEWVVVLDKLLGPGQHLISIGAMLKDGTTVIAETSIAVEIYADHSTKPLVALLPESRKALPILLQSPDDTNESSRDSHIALDRHAAIMPRSLAWQDQNQVTIAGQSSGGVRVLVSANGKSFGDAMVLTDSTWQLTGALEQSTPTHFLEFVLVDNVGQAVAAYNLPVRSRDLQKGLDGSKLVIVNKGDALWRIAYRSYGAGVRYVDIVRKNTVDIENPDLIYPNQIFALPKTAPSN